MAMTISDSDLGTIEFKVRGDLTDFQKAREQLVQLRAAAAQVIDFGVHAGNCDFGFESRDPWSNSASNQMDSSIDSFIGGAESMLIKHDDTHNVAGLNQLELEPAVDIPRLTRVHKKAHQAHKAHEAAIDSHDTHDALEFAHLRNSENFITMPAAEGESYALAADHHPAQQHAQTAATNTKEVVDLLREIAGKLPQGQIISLFSGM